MEPEPKEKNFGNEPGNSNQAINTAQPEPVSPMPVTDTTEPAATATASATNAVAPSSVSKASKLNLQRFFQTIWQVIIKPVSTLRAALPSYSDWQNSGILAGIVLVASVLLSIIAGFFSMVFHSSCSGFGSDSSCEISIDFDLLEYWKFGEFLLHTICSTAVIMLVVAGVFFGIAKLMKSQKANFWRSLTVVSLAMVPLVITGFVASVLGEFTFVGNFIAQAVGYIALAGLLYAAIIFYEGTTTDTDIAGDKKVYFVLLATVATLIALSIVAWLIGDKIGLTSALTLL